MKPLSIIQFFIFLLCMLVYQCTHGQQGYLITLKGDSIAGEIKTMFYGIEQKVQVKTPDDKQIFSILETRKFSINEEVFVPIRTATSYTFMKVLMEGYASLYGFRPENQQAFDGRYLVKADGASMELPNIGFKKQMAKFFDDCGSISERIEAGELTKKDLELIINQYNECISNRTNQAIAAKPIEVAPDALAPWNTLEQEVGKLSFDDKGTALEMITDVKNRLRQGQKIPNYLVDGLKNLLANQPDVSDALSKALAGL